MKRIDALRDLSDDHYGALVLARRCKKAAGGVTAAGAAELWDVVRTTFARELEPHFAIEERHLLPALDAAGEPELASLVRADHAALRAAVAAPAADAAALERFGRLLEDHVRLEERRVFEVAQVRLPEPALRAIEEACRAERATRA